MGDGQRQDRARVFATKLARIGAARRKAGPVLVALGLLLLIPFGFEVWSDASAFMRSRPTTCTIIGKRLTTSSNTSSRSSGTRETTFYAPEFTMRYDVDGRQRIASGYDGTATSSGGAAHNQEILDRYALWHDYPCWYDPSDAGHVVLKRNVSLIYLLAIWPLLMLAVGVGFVRSGRGADAAPGNAVPQPEATGRGAALPQSAAAKAGGKPARRWIRDIAVYVVVAVAFLAVFFAVVVGVQLMGGHETTTPEADRLAMFEYFETGNLGSVRAHIEYGVPVDSRDANGVPLLTRTLERCDIPARDGDYGEFAAYLLHKGAGVNARSNDGGTPLIAAARACPAALLRTLIGAGAQINDRSNDGTSALGVATRQNRGDVAEMLRSSGARN